MNFKTFDPSQISVVFGTSAIVGFAEDTMITIETEDKQYNDNADIYGNITRYKVNKNLAKVTIQLTQSSSSNNDLSIYAELDRVNNAGSFPVMIKDPNGTSLFSSTAAYIEQIPSVEFGAEAKTREWVIKATNVSNFIGGIK
jgi:hypothetical protein